MMEIVLYVMQIASALVIVAGGVLVFGHMLHEEGLAAPAFGSANDFEIDYRRVLAFARLPVHR